MAYERLIYENENGNIIELSPYSMFWTNVQKDATGINDVTADLVTTESYGGDGSNYVSSKIKEKTISISGAIHSLDKAEQHRYMRTMLSVLNPKYSGTLTYNLNGYKRSIEVHAKTAPQFTHTSVYPRYAITFQATNPFWNETETVSKDVLGWIGKWEWLQDDAGNKNTTILEDNFVFGLRTGDGYVDVFNESDVPCGAVFTIENEGTADVSGVKILNIDTGEYILESISLQASEKLVIDTRKGKKGVTYIKTDSESSYFSALSAQSTFIQLAVGHNRFKVSLSSGNIAFTNVSVAYEPCYLGV